MKKEEKHYIKGTVELEIVGMSGDTLDTITFHGEDHEIQKLLADCLTDGVMKSGIVPGDILMVSPVMKNTIT